MFTTGIDDVSFHIMDIVIKGICIYNGLTALRRPIIKLKEGNTKEYAMVDGLSFARVLYLRLVSMSLLFRWQDNDNKCITRV